MLWAGSQRRMLLRVCRVGGDLLGRYRRRTSEGVVLDIVETVGGARRLKCLVGCRAPRGWPGRGSPSVPGGTSGTTPRSREQTKTHRPTATAGNDQPRERTFTSRITAARSRGRTGIVIARHAGVHVGITSARHVAVRGVHEFPLGDDVTRRLHQSDPCADHREMGLYRGSDTRGNPRGANPTIQVMESGGDQQDDEQ